MTYSNAESIDKEIEAIRHALILLTDLLMAGFIAYSL